MESTYIASMLVGMGGMVRVVAPLAPVRVFLAPELDNLMCNSSPCRRLIGADAHIIGLYERARGLQIPGAD